MKKSYLIILAMLLVGAVILTRDTRAPSEAHGRMVLALTDAASLQNVSSVLLTINEVRIHSAIKGWVSVSDNAKQFDLLRLKENGNLALLADVSLPADTYDQIRLTVKEVRVTMGNVTAETAKLPSGDLKIMGAFTVEDGKTSTAVLDFMADESLHLTGNGKIIFAPVIKLEPRRAAEAIINSEIVEVKNGTVETDESLGMDENGEMKKGFVLNEQRNLKLDIVGDTIKLVTPEQKETGIKITAQKAIEIAVNGKYLDTTLSVKLLTKDGTQVWRVVGAKNLEITNVYVNVTTGTVVTTE